MNWLEDKEYQYNKNNIEKEWDFIKTRILAEHANLGGDRNEYYKKIISRDTTVIEAIKHFEEAKALLN